MQGIFISLSRLFSFSSSSSFLKFAFNSVLSCQCVYQRNDWFQGETECFTEVSDVLLTMKLRHTLDKLRSVVFPDLGGQLAR